MKVIQKLLRNISLSIPSSRPSHPSLDAPEQWQAYWEARGQPWRTEPEIDLQRQAELMQRRVITPDIEQGIYPFKSMKLSRADIEWLLATHENGQGPVYWINQSQQDRKGLDLRGADLAALDLQDLPLARMRGGLHWEEWIVATGEQRLLAAIHLERTNLSRTHLEHATLRGAYLERANLSHANLERATLHCAHLEGANFFNAHLEGASLWETFLGGKKTLATKKEKRWQRRHLPTISLLANLQFAVFDHTTHLDHMVLDEEQYSFALLADVRWNGANLTVIDWAAIKMLGDEYVAHQRTTPEGNVKDQTTQLKECRTAVRANRQLAVALQAQGLNEQASRFAYRAQVLQRRVLWLEATQQRAKLRQRAQALGAWLFSWFLFLLAGYGYKPGRSFLAYLLIIVGFAVLYLGLDSHLAWYEAIVVSMTAFHGRGFSPSTFSPGDPLSVASAFEAFVGLIIEVTFIATLTQRFFNK